MKTAITILAVFFVIGFLVAIGTLVFGFGSFSESLPKGEGGIYEFKDGSFKQLPGSAGLKVRDFLFSKANDNVIYAGTAGDGIWVSKDSGETFQKAQDKILQGRVDIYDIEEDVSGNLYSSIYSYQNDRGSLVFSSYPPESSAEIYFSSIPKFGVFGSSVDGASISIISSDGGFYRSINNGRSWELRSRQNEGLLKMESYKGSKYILTSGNKLLETSDFGKTWRDISPKEGGGSAKIKIFALDKATGAVAVLSDKILKKYGFKPIKMASPASAWKDGLDIEITEEDLSTSYVDKDNNLLDLWMPYGIEIGYRYAGNQAKDFSGQIKDEESFAALISIIRKAKIK